MATIVSIITLCWNQSHLIKGFLFSLEEAHKNVLSTIELILINNGSLDDTRKYIESYMDRSRDKYYNIILKNNDVNLGFSIGNNQGAAAATGNYFFFVNNDVVFYDQCVPTFKNKYTERTKPDAIMGPRLLSHNTGWNMLHDKPVPYLEGWALFMPSHVYTKLCKTNDGKIFDERFSPAYFEDVDLSLRAKLNNIELFNPEGLPIHHLGSRTSQRTPGFKYVATAQANQVKFLEKWNHLKPEDF